ncbi:MAG: hypothetical protein AB2A00_29835 [Myxococcota bacterium]
MTQAMERVTATFDRETLDAIKEVAGPRGRSAFLQAAAKEHLARTRLLRVLDELDAECGKASPAVEARVKATARRVFRP